MLYNPLVDKIMEWWYSWWGKREDYSKYPIKLSRIIIACLLGIIGVGIPIIMLIILQSRFNIFNQYTTTPLGRVNALLVLLGLVFILVGFSLSKLSDNLNKNKVPQLSWFKGFGHWWQ